MTKEIHPDATPSIRYLDPLTIRATMVMEDGEVQTYESVDAGVSWKRDRVLQVDVPFPVYDREQDRWGQAFKVDDETGEIRAMFWVPVEPMDPSLRSWDVDA